MPLPTAQGKKVARVTVVPPVLNTVGLFRIDVTSLANSLTRDIDAGTGVSTQR